jgi:hypothetical protein
MAFNLIHRPKIIGSLLLGLILLMNISIVSAQSMSEDFEGFNTGSVDGQGGWQHTNVAPPSLPHDYEIVDNSLNPYTAPASFGSRSLRISSASIAGDQTSFPYSAAISAYAGETTSLPGSPNNLPYIQAQWDFTSFTGAHQPTQNRSLAIISFIPYGRNGTMNNVIIEDVPGGFSVWAQGFTDNYPHIGTFNNRIVTSNLPHNEVHTIRMAIIFRDNAQPRGDYFNTGTITHDAIENDIVCVWVNNGLVHESTSWGNYYRRYFPRHPLPHGFQGYAPSVNSLQFHNMFTNTSTPETQGAGLLMDNISINAGPIPTGMENGCTPVPPVVTPTPVPVTTVSTTPPSGDPIACEYLQQNTHGAMIATGTVANVTNGSITGNGYCRVIAQDSVFIENTAEIGNPELLAMGVSQAVDVFGMLPNGHSHVPFASPAEICLRGTGTLYFADAADLSRAIRVLPAYAKPGYTCASLTGSGTVALVNAHTTAAPVTEAIEQNAAPQLAPGSEIALDQCRVTTQYAARLRAQANTDSEIIAQLPYELTLDAVASSGDWYRVIYENTQGWVRNDLIVTAGDC